LKKLLLANCFIKMNYQPIVQNPNANVTREMCSPNLNVQRQSTASPSSVRELKFFFNGYADSRLTGLGFTPGMTAITQKQCSPLRQTSEWAKVQSYEGIPSIGSPVLSSGQIFSPRSLSSPHQHHKTFNYPSSKPKWVTENPLSMGGYCHMSTYMSENQGFTLHNNKDFQFNQQRVIRQNQHNNYHSTLPGSQMSLPPVTGAYHCSVGSNSSSGARFESRRIPKHKRRVPVHLQKKFSPSQYRSPFNKFRPTKIGYKNNSIKPEKITKFLYDILVKCSLFKGVYCDDVASNAIIGTIKEMYTYDLKNGEILVRQGDIGDAFFLVEYGGLDVLVEQKTEDGRHGRTEIIKVAEIKEKETVGETALMYNTKRSATLKATQPTRVWIMEAKHFHKIRYLIKDLTNKKVNEQQKFLSRIPLFFGMKPHELTNLTQACHEVTFKPGETIISGDKSTDDDWYIIKKGKAWVVRDRRNSIAICRGQEVGKGDYFMRKIFQKEDLRTLEASSNVQCLRIPKEDFDFLVSPYLNKYNDKHGDLHSESSYTDTGSDEELPKNFENRVTYKLEDFTDIAIAGVGSFGRVKLVKAGEGPEKRVFALKEVEKNKAINMNQSEHMKNERRAMFMMDSPFIVKLFATYQDSTCVYFLLEKVLGGELFHLLRKFKSFNESMSRFYTGCVVLALEHVHSHGIVYRDLKPENLLITRSGYIKVTDFGFAKKRNQSTSFCGTPAYLAPELITGGVQNFGVDWWCLGIFLFEMLVGHVPFNDSESRKQHEDILTSSPKLPNCVTWESQELIHGLLEKNAFRRLGSSPRGAGDIKKHCWFGHSFREDKEPFDWNRLQVSKLSAPYKPYLLNDEDIRYLSSSSQKVQQNTELSRDFDLSLFQWCKEF